MKKTFATLTVAALTMLSAFASAETYAVIIGINDYPEPVGADGKPLKDDEGNIISDDLKGCVNDAKFWQGLLSKSFGVKSENIHMLLDGAATEANFIKEVTWLVETVKAGDKIFFSYSGHGSQMELSDQPEEADGLTEVICLVDSLIPDNFFAEWSKDMRNVGVHATFEFDSCHSGGLDKDFVKDGKIARNKWLPKQRLSAKQRANHFDAIEQAEIMMASNRPRAANAGSYVFLMASGEGQTSSDVEFVEADKYPPQGAFTYMVKESLTANPKLSLEELLVEVKAGLKDWEFEQIPKAEYSDAKRPAKPVIA
jgi:hypothetical protein